MITYKDSTEIRLLDQVRSELGPGRVVAIIEKRRYASSLVESEWAYLKTGILIDYDLFGLVEYTDSIADVDLMHRG